MRGRDLIGGAVAAGGGGLVAVVHYGPAHQLCNSTLGELGQAFSHQATVDCTTANGIYYLGVVAIVAGAIMLLAGLIIIGTGKEPPATQGHHAQGPPVTESSKPSECSPHCGHTARTFTPAPTVWRSRNRYRATAAVSGATKSSGG